MRVLGKVFCAAVLLACVAVCLIGEYLFVMTLSPWFLGALLAVAAAVFLVGGSVLRSQFLRTGAVMVALFVLSVRLLALSPAKPFRRFYLSLRPGMTKEMVLAECDRRFPAGGRFKHPFVWPFDGRVLTLTLDPTDGNFDSEIVQVLFDGTGMERANYLFD